MREEEEHAQRPCEVGDDGSENPARHPALQTDDDAEQHGRQDEEGDASGSRDDGIHDGRDENGMPTTHRGEERTPIEQLLGDAVHGSDDGHDGKGAEAGVIKQSIDRLTQHRDPGHDEGPDEEQHEEQQPKDERLHDRAAPLVTAAGVRPAKMQWTGQERAPGPHGRQGERRGIEQAITRWDAQSPRIEHEPDDEGCHSHHAPPLEGPVRLGMVASHGHDKGSAEEPLQFGECMSHDNETMP